MRMLWYVNEQTVVYGANNIFGICALRVAVLLYDAVNLIVHQLGSIQTREHFKSKLSFNTYQELQL